MIQFNLLPDVKLEFIKAQRQRRLVLSVSIIVSLASIVLLILLLSVDGLQKKHLSDLSRDVTSESTTLQNKPNINTILTVQNQLESLTTLHNGKPAAPRLFTYLNELTPATVSVNSLTIDFTADTVTIAGNADALSSVNQFVDTLKLTNYTATGGASGDVKSTPAFNNVVLASFSLSTTSKDPTQAAAYSITFAYDKNIFDTTQTVNLEIPTVTTRAQLQTPTDLFKASATPTTTTSGGGN